MEINDQYECGRYKPKSREILTNLVRTGSPSFKLTSQARVSFLMLPPQGSFHQGWEIPGISHMQKGTTLLPGSLLCL